MKLELLFTTCVIEWCFGVRLNPLENNDKLQDISNLFVAEWQWESWPVKEDPSEKENRFPSQRKNVALWKDNSGSAWYLFGGQPVNGDPKKVYSDVWKFTVKTRAWKRLFPTQTNTKELNMNKTGGMMPLLNNFLNEENALHYNLALQKLILCGGSKLSNPSKIKKLKRWNSLKRKLEEDETEEKLTSLAVYSPRISKSNTVWQIDAKTKLWIAHTCCCPTSKQKNENPLLVSSKALLNGSNTSYPNQQIIKEVLDTEIDSNVEKKECSTLNTKIDKAEDEVDNEDLHLKINNLKSKKKKINQIRSNSDKTYTKKIKLEKRGSDRKNESDEAEISTQKVSTINGSEGLNKINRTKFNNTFKQEESSLKLKVTTQGRNQSQKLDILIQPQGGSKYCPEFANTETIVTWCDGRNEAIVTSDISSPDVKLWVFNLSTGQWTQLQIKVSDGVIWPGCSNMNSIRYAGNEEEVYIACSQIDTTTSTLSPNSSEDSSDFSKIPSKHFKEKLVFKINYKERMLYDLGSIQLNSHFNSLEGERLWQNESEAILQVIKNSENETILILAYLNMVDLWVLSKDQKGKESFHVVEKIWRGSALKWFDKYNAALYSLQFISESGSSEIILLPNPRKIGINEYWPRERGRFIIRTFRNENLKNQSFENRTREQNLTYELLQSDYKPIGSENQLNQVYGLKVVIFFGISLSIFTLFGTVLFLKKCVNCPPRIRLRNECHKSPMVIRYSVIPDDLLYPVA